MHTFDLFTKIFKWQEKVQGKRLQVLLQLSFSNSVLCFEDKHCFLAAIPNRRNCVKWEDLSLLHVTRRDTGCLSVTWGRTDQPFIIESCLFQQYLHLKLSPKPASGSLAQAILILIWSSKRLLLRRLTDALKRTSEGQISGVTISSVHRIVLPVKPSPVAHITPRQGVPAREAARGPGTLLTVHEGALRKDFFCPSLCP